MSNYNLEVLNVLVVDDDLNMHAIVKALLNAMQITEIKFCADVPNAFDTMYNSCPDIIITDLLLTWLAISRRFEAVMLASGPATINGRTGQMGWSRQ